jgi:cell volume regulation protein A
VTLALSEPGATAAFLAVIGLLLAACAVFARALDRVGIPVVLVFLLLGMIGGSEGLGGIVMEDYNLAFRLGTIALILILFDGGMNTSWRAIRANAAPAGLLATVGVVATAALLALIARALGLSWTEALLIGAIVSSTDAAAVFAVLRGGSLKLRPRVRDTIEVESCLNDPMAVILTLGVVEFVRLSSDPGSPTPPLWSMTIQVPIQLVIGALVGAGIGHLARLVLIHARLSNGGLFPVITIAAALAAFGVATVGYGSGFLAVFVCGAVVGNGAMPYKAGLRRIHDAAAWMSQVCMFLMLGLLVFPSQLLPVAGIGLLLGLALAILVRPLVVIACLAIFRWPVRESGYIGWVGLRGAVPIILAIFPVMAGLPEGDRVFHIVFFIVVLSAIVPGASIVPLARRLGISLPGVEEPSAAIELNSIRQLKGDIRVYRIQPAVAACDATLADISLPPGVSVILVVRAEQLIAARGPTRLQPGDHVYIFCQPEDEPLIGLFFGDPLPT